MAKRLILFVFLILVQHGYSQLVFAELQGTPVNTSGWNLTGAAYVGNTGGDTNTDLDEIILTNQTNTSSGAVFFQEPLDLSTCNQWHVDFDFRIWEGNGADGIAFCFLDVPPVGFVSGGGVGVPATANGIKVVFDTYNNWGGANPGLQIYSGAGYDENPALSPGLVSLNNVGGNLNFIRSNNYNSATITYNNGTITLTINGTLYLNAFFPVNFAGYMGFSASTGGLYDKHSIKNVQIFADLPAANAGSDISVCSGESVQIGSENDANNSYLWDNPTLLDDPNISNPTTTIENNTSQPIFQQFIVETLITANSGACPDYDTINVTILPDLSSTENISICEDELPYFWNGIEINATSTETVSLLSVNNCDSVATLNLTVNTASFSTTDTVVCDTETPFIWNGISIDVTGIYTATLINSFGCDSSANLNATILPSQESTTDSVVCATQLPLNWNGLVFNGTDSQNTILSSLVTGCDSIVTLNLTVNPVLFSTVDSTVCETELPLFWNGLEILNAGPHEANLISLVTGCDSIVTLELVVNPTLSSTTNITICDSDLPWNWNGQQLNTSDSYQITLLSLVTGCDSLVNLNLLINPTLTSETDTTLCSSELPFSWNGLIFDAAGMQTANLQSVITGCDSLATLNCNVVANPQVEIQASVTEGCVPISINLSNPFSNENTNCAWTLSNGDTFNTCDQMITFSAAGCYDVSLTATEQGCTSSITNQNLICLDSQPIASFTAAPAVITLNNQWVQFYNASSNTAVNFAWDFGDASYSNEENPQYQYENNTFGYLATLVASTVQGCSDTASLFIECKEAPLIFIPNTFTPDEDQYNQIFMPIISPSIDPYNYTLWIYNRWGEIVFESHQPDFGWDGTYSTDGIKAKEGTYIWQIIYKMPDTDERKTLSGHVNLIR